MKRKSPYSGGYCSLTPNKVRYLKAVFAWVVGARNAKKYGIPLYIYRCECGGWHLTKQCWASSVRIDTKATAA